MKINFPKIEDAETLRQKAEEKLQKFKSGIIRVVPEVDTKFLIHELEVRQVALELQNKVLLHQKNIADTTQEKFNVIYNNSYTGYITLSQNGKILEVNQSAANMLNISTNQLLNKQFDKFMTLDSLVTYNEFLKNVFTQNVRIGCEVKLLVKNNLAIYVKVEGIVLKDSKECSLTLIDITRQKKVEEILKFKADKLEENNQSLQTNLDLITELKKEINLLLKKLGENQKFNIID